jgi:D-3-phosphoglycerate dehydrogenase
MQEKGWEVVEGFTLTKEEVRKGIDEYDAMVIRSRFKLDRDFLRHGRLKVIGRAGAGMENIDVEAAKAVGITCINTPEGNRDAVAEHALGMILMLMNKLKNADSEVRNGLWRREENRGIELYGKTIGIIGFGNMGSAFAKRLQGFGVRILALDPYVRIDHNTFPFVEQSDEARIFDECDVVSLHLPLTEETSYMVNDTWLSRFRKPIFLINTARGKNLDTAALVKGIENGRVRGACLDVLEFEATSFEKMDTSNLPAPLQFLMSSDKVTMSPHIAGWTFESHEKISRILAVKILHVFNQQ